MTSSPPPPFSDWHDLTTCLGVDIWSFEAFKHIVVSGQVSDWKEASFGVTKKTLRSVIWPIRSKETRVRTANQDALIQIAVAKENYTTFIFTSCNDKTIQILRSVQYKNFLWRSAISQHASLLGLIQSYVSITRFCANQTWSLIHVWSLVRP